MKIEIDTRSGFCFGVVKAIQTAEQQIENSGELYCLGDIVHNEEEVRRLEELGLKVTSHDLLVKLKGEKVLIRAHGEPPSTYREAKENNIEIIDATCPVVLKLQQRVHKAWLEMKECNGTIIIYGKKGHAEVIGLVGQTNGEATVVESINDLDTINFSAPVTIFSQTTKEPDVFAKIVDEIKMRMSKNFVNANIPLKINNTICGQVANRKKELADFAAKHDLIIFVSGIKSSNGKMLFESCKQSNPRSYFVSSPNELQPEWFKNVKTVGIGGATSTPQWLMEKVAQKIEEIASISD
ncbi:4-hydroxy-3-methylbut-2-enyl diphosphate reductase [Tenuifilaceae bacterium CYCD]|nr:4-hydroxy-3-methylbut-2-enyl diphosphate reductase [Tenuifilaceae bacterium CYCD]